MITVWHQTRHPLSGYRRCVRCVMDTSDTMIGFDAEGVCSHCRAFDATRAQAWQPNQEGARRIQAYVDSVKRENRDKDYDVIIGLSGGVDSSYVAYLAATHGLRALVLHVDCGWNTELAVKNIESVVRHLNFDLQTVVIDWDEMRDLQLSFLKSGVANCDTPQDHALIAALYKEVVKSGVRHMLTGDNYPTECILPRSWGYTALDSRHLRAIHQRFGARPLRTFPVLSFREYCGYMVTAQVPIGKKPLDSRFPEGF